MGEPEEFLVFKQLTDTLDYLSIDYAIGGSIASSIYGKVRFTQDADINVALSDDKVEELYKALKDYFYISKDAMHEAVSNRGSFNVIHFESAFKIDIFIPKDDDFYRQLFLRRRKVKLDDSIDYLFDVVSAEDIILLKLQWFQSSGSVSERQWTDVLGVLVVQARSLDMKYLRSCSEKLVLKDILQQAIDQAQE